MQKRVNPQAHDFKTRVNPGVKNCASLSYINEELMAAQVAGSALAIQFRGSA